MKRLMRGLGAEDFITSSGELKRHFGQGDPKFKLVDDPDKFHRKAMDGSKGPPYLVMNNKDADFHFEQIPPDVPTGLYAHRFYSDQRLHEALGSQDPQQLRDAAQDMDNALHTIQNKTAGMGNKHQKLMDSYTQDRQQLSEILHTSADAKEMMNDPAATKGDLQEAAATLKQQSNQVGNLAMQYRNVKDLRGALRDQSKQCDKAASKAPKQSSESAAKPLPTTSEGPKPPGQGSAGSVQQAMENARAPNRPEPQELKSSVSAKLG